MAEHLIHSEQEGWALATVMARRAVGPAAVGAALELELRDEPVAVSNGAIRAIGTGPGAWLVIDTEPDHGFADALQDRLEGLASVSDQSSGYAVFRLSGAGARTALQRGAAIDFHPDVFAPGSVATTAIAHIGAIVWQVDDSPTYDVAVFRSLSGSFRHWLEETAAAL
ncbi:MAG: sarcosine oxidase subunit gamma [Novosphingobium sp.]|nr:sarcosine oxidase subunit gamma [Novosphingobium sp.]MCP5403240.1 sarcosine oxidase subunit gamma [Novosphingobium sp.]